MGTAGHLSLSFLGSLQGYWYTGLNLALYQSAEQSLLSFYSCSLYIFPPWAWCLQLLPRRMKFFGSPDLVFNTPTVFAFLLQSHLPDMAVLGFVVLDPDFDSGKGFPLPVESCNFLKFSFCFYACLLLYSLLLYHYASTFLGLEESL